MQSMTEMTNWLFRRAKIGYSEGEVTDFLILHFILQSLNSCRLMNNDCYQLVDDFKGSGGRLTEDNF